MRRLGQHFLKDKKIINAIIDSIEIKNYTVILEVGSGHGELTLPLASICEKNNCSVITIEKDPDLALALEQQGKELKNNLRIIHGDALKILPEIIKRHVLPNTKYAVVGNIPYYITGRLLRVLGSLERKPARSTVMIQKEVAERIVAEPPRMNRLAAFVRAWAEPKLLFSIPPDAFRPAPKIHSAIIQLDAHKHMSASFLHTYNIFAATLFSQPRKTLLNNMEKALTLSREELLKKLTTLGYEPKTRPHTLNVEDIVQIGRTFSKFLK